MLRKSLIFAPLLIGLALPTASKADVFINGTKYRDGCYGYNMPGGRFGIKCPVERRDPKADFHRNMRIPSYGGHASTFQRTRQDRGFQSFNECQSHIARFSVEVSDFNSQMGVILRGRPEQRVLTYRAAKWVKERLRSHGMNVIQIAEDKYRFRKRGEDGSNCIAALEEGRKEFRRVVRLIRSEAAKGNRDLVGTGLNPHVSLYNN